MDTEQTYNKKGFRKLIVWQRMLELVVLLYKFTEKFPKSEIYGLVSQTRRAVVSVLSNFVEGYIKSSKKEKKLYLERSVTSLQELEAQVEISCVLGFITTAASRILQCSVIGDEAPVLL